MPYDQRQKDAMAVAHLTYQHPKMTQREIAEALGITTQSEVSKLLDVARREEWLVNALNLPTDLTDAEKSDIKNRGYPKLLALSKYVNSLQAHGRIVRSTRVHVFFSGSDEARKLETFGRAAADRVIGLLKCSKFAAIAWGRTIMSVVEGIEAAKPDRLDSLTLIPLSGEPGGHRDYDASASAAATRLGKAFGCRSFSLRGVHVRIPISLAKSAKVIKKFVSQSDEKDNEERPWRSRDDDAVEKSASPIPTPIASPLPKSTTAR